MGAVGKDYGSERHLLSYRQSHGDALDTKVLQALGAGPTASIRWLYPDQSGQRGKEFTGIAFLQAHSWAKGSERALTSWKGFWPRGRAQSWDGVAVLEEAGRPVRWLLFEAKSNHPEFVGARCKATPKSLPTIEAGLNQTKRRLGVHRFFDWTGSYYQHANRLAATDFLNRHGVPATLVELFFTGDRFPDGTRCPADQKEWCALLEARRLTLGLATDATRAAVVEAFLPVPARTP